MKPPLIAIILFVSLVGSAFTAFGQSEAMESKLFKELQIAKEDTNKVRLLIEIATFYQTNPSLIKKYSPFSYAERAEALANKIGFKKGLGETYRRMAMIRIYHEKDTAAAIVYTQKAIDVFRELDDLNLLGEATFDMNAYYNLQSPDLEERIKWTEISLSVFKRAMNLRKMADCSRQLGDVLLIAGRSLQAMQVLKEALKQYQAVGEDHVEWVYDLLGHAYYGLGEYAEAEKYGQLAVKLIEAQKHFNGYTATIYNRMAVTYQALKEYQKAKYNYDKAMELAMAANKVDAIYIIAGNIATLMRSMGHQPQAQIYLRDIMQRFPIPDLETDVLTTSNLLLIAADLKDTGESNKLSKKLIRLLDHDEQLNWRTQKKVYFSLIEYCWLNKKYALQRQYLSRYIALSRNNAAHYDLANAHLWTFRLDSIQGNFLGAMKHYQHYRTLKDSLFDVIKTNQVKDLEVLYQKEKKENELAGKEKDIMLLTKKTEFRNLEVKQAVFTRNIIIGILVLSVAVIVLLIIYSRGKRKSTRSLQIRQIEIEKQNKSLNGLVEEKDWLVKEIHHRVKNNFHMVMALLGTQSRFLNEEESSGIIKSQHRIHAISLLHIKLYQSDNLSQANIATYAHDLLEYLKACYNVPFPIIYELNVQPVYLDIAYAQPIGLILNEAITNCMKHAFNDRGGRVIVTIRQFDGNNIYVEIFDNGRGLTESFNLNRVDTMGYNLIRKCCEELNATLDVDNIDGTRIKVTFAMSPVHELMPLNSSYEQQL